MTIVITIACISVSLTVLGFLAIIDLRTRLLPNKYVLVFFVAGLFFHLATNFKFISVESILFGALAGGGLLLVIRTIANRIYKQDTLGLGDVKLMTAAGVWLGADYIFLALSIGAFAGLVHGIMHGFYLTERTGDKTDFSKLTVPAGPGFIFGVITSAFFAFHDLPNFLLDLL